MNSALMNLFLKKWRWLYLRPYMDTKHRPYLRIHQTSHMYTVCFNCYCMNVTKVSYLSTVSLTQLDEIITFYSLYNYQSIFYHWHIKPIGPCYSSIMDIWHHGGGETIMYNSWGQSFVLFWISKEEIPRVSSKVCRTVLSYAHNQHLLFHWLFYEIAQ